LDEGEGCDEEVSGKCNACQCDAGFVLGENGRCVDIDECAAYACAFLGGEDVTCETPDVNVRVCTCSEGRGDIEGAAEGTTSITLEGFAPFPGCTDVDEPSVNEIVDGLIANPTTLATLLKELIPRASGVSVSEGEMVEGQRQLVISFTVPDGADVMTIADDLANYIAELFGLSETEITVVINPTAKRAEAYTATVTFTNADAAGHVVVSLVALVSVLFYQLF
jgi:hypothetical protein